MRKEARNLEMDEMYRPEAEEIAPPSPPPPPLWVSQRSAMFDDLFPYIGAGVDAEPASSMDLALPSPADGPSETERILADFRAVQAKFDRLIPPSKARGSEPMAS